MQVKTQQLEPDMEKQTGSKLGKEYIKAVYCHSAYLTYMQSTSYEMLGQINQNQDYGRNINLRKSDATLVVEAKIKNLLLRVKYKSEKAGLKLNIQKTKIMTFGPITSWQMDGEKAETVSFHFLVLQNQCIQ